MRAADRRSIASGEAATWKRRSEASRVVVSCVRSESKQAMSTRKGSGCSAATSATAVGRHDDAWRRSLPITFPISSADIGARRAAASQRGLGDSREWEGTGRISGDGTSALAEGTSEAERVSNGAGFRRLRRPSTLRALTTAHGPPDHRFEMSVLHGLATALLGAGLGVQIFLSFLVAPAAFRVVDRPVAARVMEGVFPGYYGFGLTTLAMALALVLVLVLREPTPLRWGTAALLGLTLVGTVYAGHVLLPEAHAARLRAQAAPAGDLAPLEFSRLHRRAVAVNITIFVAGAVALVLHLAAGAGGRARQGQGEPTSRVISERASANQLSGRGF
jgi:hypothetical protein